MRHISKVALYPNRMPLMQRFDGKQVVVTGAASGIGLACCQRLAAEGATVIGFDLQNVDQQNKAPWETLVAARNARFYQLDVRDFAAQQKAIENSVAEFGAIDALITAAGIADAGPVHMLDEDAWQRVIDINLKGTFLSIKAVLPSMIAARSGSIITIASIEGIVGTEGGSAYNASKGGVVMLTKNIAIDYGRIGIRCNAICPGFIDTPMSRAVFGFDFMQDFKQGVVREAKLGRLGQPEEIAATAAFLASSDASFITGQAIAVDGGYTAGHSHGLVELMGLT